MKLFPTEAQESRSTRLWRLYFNLYPAIRGTGGWLRFLSGDWHEAHLSLRLNLRTYNYKGTIFGGAMFAAGDPLYMLMLIKIMGEEYVIWDKAASIRFLRPAKTRLRARFLLSPEAIAALKADIEREQEIDRTFSFEYVDAEGTVYARSERTIYLAKKAFFQAKRGKRKAGSA
jgi:acyl-coenzyme A thioesterase PaaI-like protein